MRHLRTPSGWSTQGQRLLAAAPRLLMVVQQDVEPADDVEHPGLSGPMSLGLVDVQRPLGMVDGLIDTVLAGQ
jgi:hypothetical protein